MVLGSRILEAGWLRVKPMARCAMCRRTCLHRGFRFDLLIATLAGDRTVSIVVVVYVDRGLRFLPCRIASSPGAVAAFLISGEDMAD